MKKENFPELKNLVSTLNVITKYASPWIKKNPPKSISDTEISEHPEERDYQITFREKT